jgi:hypothetical protein
MTEADGITVRQPRCTGVAAVAVLRRKVQDIVLLCPSRKTHAFPLKLRSILSPETFALARSEAASAGRCREVPSAQREAAKELRGARIEEHDESVRPWRREQGTSASQTSK